MPRARLPNQGNRLGDYFLPTGQILSSTPLFRKAYGSNTAHIDQLPFTIDDPQYSQQKDSVKKLEPTWRIGFAHTIILPMDYDKYFTKHQALLHLLAESPIVESVQCLNL